MAVKNIEVVQLISKFANSFSNLTHKLVGNAQISGYLYVRKAVSYMRILAQEVVVTLFSGFAKGINHTAL